MANLKESTELTADQLKISILQAEIFTLKQDIAAVNHKMYSLETRLTITNNLVKELMDYKTKVHPYLETLMLISTE